MAPPQPRDIDRRYSRALRVGLALSVLAHALLFLIFTARPLPLSPFAAAGQPRGDFQAALGGGMQAVELRAPAPPTQSPPEPIPDPEEDEPELEPEEPETEPEQAEPDMPVVALADRLTLPGNVGPLPEPGTATGTGRGDGGTEEEGLFRVVPPRPRGLILPPGDRPDDVRGREIEVWVYVTAGGKVVPDSTRLNPPTGHRGFDRRLREHAAGWVFEAAERDGRPVAEWFRYTIIM